MEKSSRKTLKELGMVYEKHLLGTPLEKMNLNAVQFNQIQLFERFNAVGRSACQISEESCGAITGDVAAVLRRVKKEFRKKVKTIRGNRFYRATKKIIEADPAYSKFTIPENGAFRAKLTLPEVFSLRLGGSGVVGVRNAGGSDYQYTKSGKVRMMIERGNLKVEEIAGVAKVTAIDVKKCLRIYKVWKEKNKVEVKV